MITKSNCLSFLSGFPKFSKERPNKILCLCIFIFKFLIHGIKDTIYTQVQNLKPRSFCRYTEVLTCSKFYLFLFDRTGLNWHVCLISLCKVCMFTWRTGLQLWAIDNCFRLYSCHSRCQVNY